MGLYLATVKLFCDSKDGDILKRFAEINTQTNMTQLGLMLFDNFDAPDTNGSPPTKFTNAVESVIQAALSAEILKDISSAPSTTVDHVMVFSSWSPPTGTNPHEGKGVVQAVLRLANGNMTPPTDWEIKRGTAKAPVVGFAQWRYIDAVISTK